MLLDFCILLIASFKSQRTSQAFQTSLFLTPTSKQQGFQIPTDITGLSNAAVVSVGPLLHQGFKSQRTSQAFQTGEVKICLHKYFCFKSQRTSQAFQTMGSQPLNIPYTLVSNPNGHHRPFKRESCIVITSLRGCFKSQRKSQAFQTSSAL